MTTAMPAVATEKRRLRLPPLWVFAAVTVFLLVRAAGQNVFDISGYHCYALAFWAGAAATHALQAGSCLVPASALAKAPFHTLPNEYGPLALLAFLPPLVFPLGWYDTAFAIEIAIVVVAVAYLLERYGAPGAGYIWLIYTLIGDMIPAAARFDVVTSACVVVALIAARRQRLPLAYVALAVGTLQKLYPLALLPLLLIESWRARDQEPLWRGPTIFAGIFALVEGLAATVSLSSALSPLRFMSARCVQVESLPATIGYIWVSLLHSQPTFTFAFNSTCEVAPGLPAAQIIALVLGIVAIALTITLFWRQRVTLNVASLLIIGALIVGSKVFSPQYVLWLSPIVALEYGVNASALIGWGIVCIWTTLCFPMSYDGQIRAIIPQPPDVMVPVTAGVRNVLLIALGARILWRRYRPTAATQQAETDL